MCGIRAQGPNYVPMHVRYVDRGVDVCAYDRARGGEHIHYVHMHVVYLHSM